MTKRVRYVNEKSYRTTDTNTDMDTVMHVIDKMHG